jgi:tRNA (mo5U34)-methyltransferase
MVLRVDTPESLALPPEVDRELLRRLVHGRPWWHQIDLGDGLITPGPDPSPEKLKGLAFPEDLAGMAVLDIGAYDGFFSFEAERRGAARVVAADYFCWTIPAESPTAGASTSRTGRSAVASRSA